ncbi:extracellular calcium-sensing receptor-like [Polypterus senegalus]|uniref:extracellular calcium-sensing receptor-like n=1 Tax=Polypterus senegalus TaxID=55291 RepID=UPI00196288FA|nr:extracellular calcium-sensing receptor-like [Polypterus senegalus]
MWLLFLYCLFMSAFFLCLIILIMANLEHKCKLQDNFNLNGIYKKGQIILGGLFEINYKTIIPELSFKSKPEPWKCESLDFIGVQSAQTMVFAIEEINKDETLLPNVTLGYRIFDNCLRLPVALRTAVTLVGGLDEVSTEYNCSGIPPVLAIVGDPGSTHSIALSRIVGLFHMPLVSYYATCACLSNKQEYPSFFRTIPSDTFQVKAMAQIIKYFNWSWVGIIGSDDDYGHYAVRTFYEEIAKFGCISFSVTIPKVNEISKVQHIINTIKQSTAKVIIIFSPGVDVNVLVKEAVRQNITGRQWIASEGWSTSTVLLSKENFRSFGGTIGIAIHRGNIPGLKEFLLQVHPDTNSGKNLIHQFWEKIFECKFSENVTNSSTVPSWKECTGEENISNTQTAYSDVSDLRASYNVYKAVYAIAHALHNLNSCEKGNGPFENNSCADIANVQPWQLHHYLKQVSFSMHSGERVAFDENGDALAIYDIVNWQLNSDGNTEIKTIGVFDKASGSGQELFLKEDEMFWNFATAKPPESVCSKSCQPGTRKATRKGEPVCCFDCIPCAEGEISGQIDADECEKCQPDSWSNFGRTQCVPKEVEFLSYEDAMGTALTAVSLSGAALSLAVLSVFIYYRETPVVKANNSELSFLLLISLILCFLCSLCFIGKPTYLTCILRHVVFGISFVLCISCILVKTIVVIMAFKATLPGKNIMKWFRSLQQRGTVFLLTLIQALICIVWLVIAPPTPSRNTKYQNAKIFLECDIGSITGFSCLMGYIGFLASICFVLAFLARKLPDNFNEAKFITFSMIIFCAVWLTFIPAYISTPGKYTVAVEIFTILASSFGIITMIFFPKCYIILIRPERNTKKFLMARADPTPC